MGFFIVAMFLGFSSKGWTCEDPECYAKLARSIYLIKEILSDSIQSEQEIADTTKDLLDEERKQEAAANEDIDADFHQLKPGTLVDQPKWHP
ncbi:MAG: hypothetical protein K8R69_08060 [Deltaproteobacteria bacterium]|nr:hypothetical protein [Deltaproteobacteria bacterium]